MPAPVFQAQITGPGEQPAADRVHRPVGLHHRARRGSGWSTSPTWQPDPFSALPGPEEGLAPDPRLPDRDAVAGERDHGRAAQHRTGKRLTPAGAQPLHARAACGLAATAARSTSVVRGAVLVAGQLPGPQRLLERRRGRVLLATAPAPAVVRAARRCRSPGRAGARRARVPGHTASSTGTARSRRR